jgi:predicted exporter
LRDFLVRPEALGFQDLLPSDPLLLMPAAAAQLERDRVFAPPAHSGLVWARLASSPLAESAQAPAFAAIDAATREIQPEFRGVTVSYTGVNRFAAASRARIEHEVAWLNVASAVAVLLVAWLFIRGVHRGLHLLPVIALSTLGAWVVTTAAFPRVHVIVFVIGSLLTGVAIDYGFYLYMQPPAVPDEDYWAKVRRLLKPLLASCFTTVTGFALLLFSDLPMIRQLGAFVGAGLLCALAAAIIYFSTVRTPFLEARSYRGAPQLGPANRRRLRRGLIVVGLLAIPGLSRISWRDDIRGLEISSPELQAENARIRALFGEQAGRSVYLTRGESIGAARESLARFERWLARSADDGAANFLNLGAVVPLPDDYRAAMRFWHDHADFAAQLRAALPEAGFDAGEFAPFFDQWKQFSDHAGPANLETAVRELAARLSGPAAYMIHLGDRQNWFVTVVTHAPATPPPPETATVSASQLQSLNQLFARYRRSALRLSLIGLAIVGLGVFLTYGLRNGLRIFAIPCGACLGLFGIFGWIGQPLNLFHLLGAFLGVCLTHNYSIFSATSAFRGEPPPVSVRLSALTSASSFGVLALSGIPVVRALGVTVAAMVLVALLVIELEHLSPLASRR